MKKTTPFELIYFAILAILALFFTNIRISTADSAYTFFRFLQLFPLNIDDLRSTNMLTWIVCRIGIRLQWSVSLIAYLYSVSFVVYTFLLYLLTKYGFRSSNGALAFLMMGLWAGPLFTNPALGAFHAANNLILLFACLEYLESLKKADVSTKLKQRKILIRKVFSHSIALFFMALAIVSSFPTASIAVVLLLLYWFLTHLSHRKAMGVYALVAVVFTLFVYKYIPEPLAFHGFTSSFSTLSLYLFPIGLLFYFFLYLILKKRFPEFILLFSFILFSSLYCYFHLEANYFALFLPLFTVFTLLFCTNLLYPQKHQYLAEDLQPTENAICFRRNRILVIVLCFISLGIPILSSQAQREKLNYFDLLHQEVKKQDKEKVKFYGYGTSVREDLLGNSDIPSIEFLNYTLLKYGEPILFFFPPSFGIKPLNIYECRKQIPILQDFSLSIEALNKNYFSSLSSLDLCILPPTFLPYQTVIHFYCDAEKVINQPSTKPFFYSKNGIRLYFAEARTTDTAYEGKASAFVCEQQPVFTFQGLFPLQPNDSVIVKVKRLGSNNGKLIYNEHGKRGKYISINEPIDQADSNGWRSLELRTCVSEGVYLADVYVFNTNEEKVYFDLLEVWILRQPKSISANMKIPDFVLIPDSALKYLEN
ncbi:MAG: hypothetical protein RR333_06460 [Bacteroidales bacterium]